MKRRIILLVTAFLALLAGVLWVSTRRSQPIVIIGNAPAQELSEIRRVVKNDMRGRILPDYSRASFKGLTANIRAYLQYDIMEINVLTATNVLVTVRKTARVAADHYTLCYYTLCKDATGWKAFGIMRATGGGVVAPARSTFLSIPTWAQTEGTLPSSENTDVFSPLPLSSDKNLTEMTLSPGKRDTVTIYATSVQMYPTMPPSSTSLTNLMPLSP